ncbi:ABC transporter ATP-binding protein [Halobellus clavatus]|jgi:ABC-type Fe3+/spermidine/putrescine transport system ATPase subunit|uniref:Molybdate/tungstate import ATP-binding protein WtpC n=1 Tax=Halobellus clavatus TaxID=660517 RepID=A0A1H3HKE0_9EURY|nr:ABC transporter ATP-binding protein [Halobellus clavatus]SDY15244.1 spermidine/putrescine transport system ATP-binding protein [Halobellus clavatus]
MADQSVISIDSLRKQFADELVLDRIDLSINDGEFCVVIGPSGCGKSTLLKCIAGVTDPDSGEIHLRGKNAEATPARNRNIGLVFQEFEETLFPHKTVEENIAFGLKQKAEPPSEDQIGDQIDEMLDLLAISHTKSSYPDELSGGQQQRVELARQLVRDCDITLFDDPLADLDYKLQKRMEIEMRRLHKELESTFLYVTHNQDQALKLADRLIVMNDGVIEQIGTPEEVYTNPANAFVGRFVGDSNLLTGNVVQRADSEIRVETPVGELGVSNDGDQPAMDSEGVVLIRPEDIGIGDGAARYRNEVDVVLEGKTYTGEITEYSVSASGHRDELQVVKPGKPDKIGDKKETKIGFDPDAAQFFEEISVTGEMQVSDLLEAEQ